MRIALLGTMGRDVALGERLVAGNHELHAIGTWHNPDLVELAAQSGGEFHRVDTIANPGEAAGIVQRISPDMFVSHSDDALAAGVVDEVHDRHMTTDSLQWGELWVPSPDRQAARIEWDKFWLRDLVNEIDPSFNPETYLCHGPVGVKAAIKHFEDKKLPCVIKPRNLTGGKGVKVMGVHLQGYGQAARYASEILSNPQQAGLEVQEKLQGHEFNLQIITDGTTMIRPPVTYDYPYREDGDRGPGTGGMGAFSMRPGEHLPFVTDADYEQAMGLMEQILEKMRTRGYEYKGVLYPAFFKTPDGLKIVEINARGGDPEFINLMDLVTDDTDMGEVLRQVAVGELQPDSMRFQDAASALVYLVSPDYGYGRGEQIHFDVDRAALAAAGVKLRFAAAEAPGWPDHGQYTTVGTSRTVGLSALGLTPWDARAKIHHAIASAFPHPLPFEYRKDVADQTYIEGLR